LQLGRPEAATSDCNANFLMLAPVFFFNAIPSGTNIVLSFPTQPGFNYQVQYKTNLTDANWIPLGAPLSGNSSNGLNTVQLFADPTIESNRFYRVQIR
jgi:hypothetical protein